MQQLIFAAFALLVTTFYYPRAFREDQQQFPRVREAYTAKQAAVLSNLKANDLRASALEILICAYKTEEDLELWARNKGEVSFRMVRSYDFCRLSGIPGPKRRRGDGQVPEGFYVIDRFNPASSYHLSLGINYPNRSDAILGERNSLGNDVFIHGKCVTIGCIPITDDKIKELYIYAVEARNNGQQHIPVYIFPFRLTDANMALVRKTGTYNHSTVAFWNNLQQGYKKFERDRVQLNIDVDNAGLYHFK